MKEKLETLKEKISEFIMLCLIFILVVMIGIAFEAFDEKLYEIGCSLF